MYAVMFVVLLVMFSFEFVCYFGCLLVLLFIFKLCVDIYSFRFVCCVGCVCL